MDKKKKEELEAITKSESELTEYQKSTYISTESFEEIRQRNQEKKESIEKWNSGFKCSSSSGCSTHKNEQSNWKTGSNYVGCGPLW